VEENAPLPSYAASDDSLSDDDEEYYDEYDPNDVPADQAADPVEYEEAPLPTYSKSDPNADPSPPSSDYSLASEEEEYDDYDPNDVPLDQAADAPELYSVPVLPTVLPDPIQGGYQDSGADLLPEYFKSEIALGLAASDDIPQVDPYTAAASQNIPSLELPSPAYGVPAAPAISLKDYIVPEISDKGFSGLGGSYGR